jgi:hypothetical protein
MRTRNSKLNSVLGFYVTLMLCGLCLAVGQVVTSCSEMFTHTVFDEVNTDGE